MELLHTEYRCEDCDVLLKKGAATLHKWDTGHNILKKIVYPNSHNEVDTMKIDLDATQEILKDIDYCLECRKEVMMPALHKNQGHSVYKKRSKV